jgi:hypothetical protein
MLVLFDHGTPSGIAPALVGHTVVEARERGWDKVSNGDLLNAAEAAGFQGRHSGAASQRTCTPSA